MKRLNSSSDSIFSFTSSTLSPTHEMCFLEDEIQAMLDSLECEDPNELEIHPTTGKKRRLSLTQVKALEKHFEADNKLERDRKVKLAMELGLHPRQVSIWFQNRRARWKNKQLEKEYEVLRFSYGELKLRYENVRREKELFVAQLRDLKLKLGEASKSESDILNHVANVDHEQMVDCRQKEILSTCSSSYSLMQWDCPASYMPENLSGLQNGNGADGVEGYPTDSNWFNN